MHRFKVALLLLLITASVEGKSLKHPHLVLNQKDVANMAQARDSSPVFKQAFVKVEAAMARQLKAKIDVPVPRDAGGGYTHEQHKRNYKAIYEAGILFQITGKGKYRDFARDMLLKYAELYPTLGEHPKKKYQSPGRLFWQLLNEAVWLVYSIQGYDAIAGSLELSEREKIEEGVLKPMADFLSDGSPATFDRVHNHGTWAAAAVGMTGYVLGDSEMVEKALYGLDKTGEAGFIKQLDQLFSPDGYYSEGPYYQRYALMPFVLFAKAIDYNDPQRKIFEYRDGVLIKAVYAAIQLSYNNLFFPINDAIKDKGLDTIELVHGVAIAYAKTRDPALLSIAKIQHTISLSGDGALVAQGLMNKLAEPFPFRSLQYRDGTAGDEGVLVILRSGKEPGHQALVAKNTSQGMGHGHFDKLNWLYFDNGNEIISDYGAARFLNIESKQGGRYLRPQNKAWAKQTVAHNTLVVDETSHFDGKVKLANKAYPEPLLFDVQDKIKITSAAIQSAYPDVKFIRTLALIKDQSLEHSLVLDVLKVESSSSHQYDLPLHYKGHITNISFPLQYSANESMNALGKKNGYQYLWLKAKAQPEQNPAQVTWLEDGRFYTYSAIANPKSEIIFTELGANDPEFNLRRETAIIQRIRNVKDYTFVSVLETHGEYNGSLEYTNNGSSEITGLKQISSGEIDYIEIGIKGGRKLGLGISYDTNEKKSHKITVDSKALRWTGFYHLFEG